MFAPLGRAFGDALSRFRDDETGTVSIETLLVIGLVSLPVILFVLSFANGVQQWMIKQTPKITDEADNLLKGP